MIIEEIQMDNLKKWFWSQPLAIRNLLAAFCFNTPDCDIYFTVFITVFEYSENLNNTAKRIAEVLESCTTHKIAFVDGDWPFSTKDYWKEFDGRTDEEKITNFHTALKQAKWDFEELDLAFEK